MIDKEIKLNKRQKEVLKALLDNYEKSKTYRGENIVNQTFKVKPELFFKDYDSNFVNLDEQEDYERDLCVLEELGLISLTKKDNVIISINMVTSECRAFYSLLGRPELKEIERDQIALYKSHIGKNSLLDAFCKKQIERLENRKKAEYKMLEACEIIRILEYVLNNEDEILERELSIELFGDTKVFEKKYRGKILTVLKKYGDYTDILDNVPDEREQGHAILAEHNVFSNPTYVSFKGTGELCFKNGRIIGLKPNVSIALDSDSLNQIDRVKVYSNRVITVENLTSFNRVKDDKSFYVYLAGYHNTAKQRFIQKVALENQGKMWFHFGDIDPDGFYILEHLKKKTGIAFKQLCMSIEELKKYKAYCKPLEENDKKKAQSLIEKGCYVSEMRYMLEKNVKLEQEVISWKQAV